MAERIRIKVSARQMVKYSQVLTLSQEEWDDFKKMSERQQGEMLGDLLDLRDVADAEPIDCFDATRIDENGNAVSPSDSCFA